MINILTIIPNIEDATSLYRGSGPLFQLRRESKNKFHLAFMNNVGENSLDVADVCFLQRPSDPNHLQIIELCNHNRIPTWVDYDDLLLAVPEDNPAHDHYMRKDTQDRIKKILSAATVVTVTTEALKNCLSQYNKNIYVIPNALPQKFLHLAKPFQWKKQVNWRGTNTHQRDIGEYGGELNALADERKDVLFTFIGYNPWFVTGGMPPTQAIIVPPMTIGDYFRFMNVTNPPIQIVPLAGHMFNLCKSNIAYLEACLTGAVTIAPNWPEWRDRPGVLTFDSNEEFKQKIEYVLDSPKEAALIHALGQKHVLRHNTMRRVNPLREQLIESLYGKAVEWDRPLPEKLVLDQGAHSS